jgi:hypothetical protein
MSNYSEAICEKCGAKMVINPKTNKEFCEKKCWLGAENQGTFEKSYNIIKDAKIEGMYNEKKENIKWMNALNNASLLIANKVILPTGSVSGLLQDMANKIYAMEAPKKETVVTPTVQVEDEWNDNVIDVKDLPF